MRKTAKTANDRESLGEIIRQQRKKLGISQTTLGDLAGCGRVFVSEVETGKITVRFDKAFSLLETLGLRMIIDRGDSRVEVKLS